MEFISSLTVNHDFVAWAKRWINHIRSQKENEKGEIQAERKQALQNLEKKLDRLTDLRMDGELGKDEYLNRKETLQKEIEVLESKNNENKNPSKEMKQAIEFLVGLSDSFEKGGNRQRDFIIRKIVSNPVLLDGKVHPQAKKHYLNLPILKRHHKGGIEPPKNGSRKGANVDLESCYTTWLGRRDSNPRSSVPKTAAVPLGHSPE